jgi:tripartite-type tricarboxylate transporter receptor subunit TctC
VIEVKAMNLARRQFLHLAAGAATASIASRTVRAQAYPTRPIRIIIGFAAGSTSGLIGRIVDQWFQERLGHPVIIENKPGAGGNVAAQSVVGSPPDGYTLLFVPTASAINATLYERLPFNFLRDIVPIAGLVQMPNLMVVNPSIPAKTVAEFIAYAKANPGAINMASPGVGTMTHLAGELFKTMTGINLVHVPYRGAAPAYTDLVSGQVQVMFDILPNSIEHARAGKVRALAVSTATRATAMPDVPTIGETVAGYEASTWWGLGAPKGTPPEIIATLNREVNAALSTPGAKARLGDLGATPFILTAAEFGALLAAETEKWGKVIRAANIKAE